jgi:hypothetical protein
MAPSTGGATPKAPPPSCQHESGKGLRPERQAPLQPLTTGGRRHQCGHHSREKTTIASPSRQPQKLHLPAVTPRTGDAPAPDDRSSPPQPPELPSRRRHHQVHPPQLQRGGAAAAPHHATWLTAVAPPRCHAGGHATPPWRRTAHRGLRGAARRRCPAHRPPLEGRRRRPTPPEGRRPSRCHRKPPSPQLMPLPPPVADPPVGRLDPGQENQDLRAPRRHHRRPPTPPPGSSQPHAADLGRGKPDPAARTPALPPRRHSRLGQRGGALRFAASERSSQDIGPAATVLGTRVLWGAVGPSGGGREGRSGKGGSRRPGLGSPPKSP